MEIHSTFSPKFCFSVSHSKMGMIFRHLKNTTILSSSTLRTLLNPLHHHSLFPSLTQFPKKTYSTTSSKRDIYSILPSPFTLTHQMSLTFAFPKKDVLKEVVKMNPEAERATVFVAFSVANKDYKAKIGDGQHGGGIVLNNVAWGYRALHLADDLLLEFGNHFKIYAFLVIPDGCVLVRIESFSDQYGCPSIKMLESYLKKYRRRLVEDSAVGMIPDDFEVGVGCPGQHRLLKVPDDLSRFKDLPMRVSYVESDGKEHDWVFLLCFVEKEEGYCLWYLSDFDPMNKDRPVCRKEGSWRLKLPFEAHKRVTFFIQT